MTKICLVFNISAVASLAVLGVAAQTAAQTDALPTQMINVEGGAMRVAIAGLADRKSGQPVVILEAGAGGGGVEAWRPVFGDTPALRPYLRTIGADWASRMWILNHKRSGVWRSRYTTS